MDFQMVPTKVLITVMTYPHPSRGHNEVVCTAGISESGEWIRLYPIDYRYRPRNQQFRKYQWIEVLLSRPDQSRDNRKESRKPDLETIKIQGPPLDVSHGWAQRRAIIDELPHFTVNQLRDLYGTDRTSLGVVRPSRILDLEIKPEDPDWKPEWKRLFEQLPLFGRVQKPLRKIPFKFSYVFECEDSAKPHHAMIEDWELGVLFLNEASRLGSDEAAAESVKKKFFGELCRSDKDTRLFMGTTFPWNSWVVVGVFWPPVLSVDPPVASQMRLPF